MTFDTSYENILKRIECIDPVTYGKTRNHVDGAVTYLSPYISRGVISTKFVMEKVLERDFRYYEIEKLIQELAWRDYWQQVWIVKRDEINKDLRYEQAGVVHNEIPVSITRAETNIEVIDGAITRLYETGYMHNHMRMYIASMACNIAKGHWYTPARWLYYHLLDGDWASNALSWQWVAGANANKKYYANQENINTFFKSDQKNTFLDVSYEVLYELDIPEVLRKTHNPIFETVLPQPENFTVRHDVPTLIYNYYNLDPLWRKDERANRILLLEPSTFEQYPVSQKSIDFVLNLKENIPGINVYVGEFDDLVQVYQIKNIIYKEHPLNHHYKGQCDERDWMFDVQGYYPSFFAFWKKAKKKIRQL